jgi:hypothetical protein
MIYNIIILIALSLSSSFSSASVIKILHYNVKELDTVKIHAQSPQLNYVKKIIKKYSPDIFSLNEIQFDEAGVPNNRYQTNGNNFSLFLTQMGLKFNSQAFAAANTGKNARRKGNGEYFTNANTALARSHADEFNFGVMPSQYSTAGAFKYKVKSSKVFTKLKWRDFNPDFKFNKFKTISGKVIPDTIELFDKNFSDITLDIDGTDVHIILFHTVPSYHFGNKFSINMARNEEQIKFMEWYLTGKTDFKTPLEEIQPLTKGSYYIAVGDFNTDIFDTKSLGAKALTRLINKSTPWIPIDKMSFTNEGGGYPVKPFRLMLDYMISSKNIVPKSGKIIHPDFERRELGCKIKKLPLDIDKTKYLRVEYKKEDKTCFALIRNEYYQFKKASDHYPIYGEFEIK